MLKSEGNLGEELTEALEQFLMDASIDQQAGSLPTPDRPSPRSITSKISQIYKLTIILPPLLALTQMTFFKFLSYPPQKIKNQAVF